MSFNIEGKQCKVCNAYLFEDDDVVFCPECGAPHHRSCYNKLGHCALEEYHGTENQYDSEKEEQKNEPPEQQYDSPKNEGIKVKCGMCGEEYDAYENVCPNCQAPNTIKMGGRFVTIDFLGGVPGEMDLGDGVTANEAKQFVLSNSQRFIPKFAKMKNGQKASFNILAFFFPCAWALSRKMYRLGAIIGTLSVALKMLTIPFDIIFKNSIPDEITRDYFTFSRFLLDNTKLFNKPAFYVAFASSALIIVLKIIMGVFGDWFYRNYTIKNVKEIKKSSDDKDSDMRKKGGVSLIMLILGILITQYLPAIIASFASI